MAEQLTSRNRAASAVQSVLALTAALVAIAWFVPLGGSGLTVSFTQEGSVLESPDGSRVELAPGTVVGPGDRIIVPDGGSVTLVSPDGHNLTATDSTDLLISSSRETLIGGRTTTEVQVEQGTVRVTGEGGPRTSLDIGLPHGVAGVRGTEFDVNVQGESARVSVHEGAVGITADDGSSVDLAPGQGVVVTAQGADVQDLPGTPQITGPAEGTVINAQGTTLTWTDVPGAAGYTVEFARDVDFLDAVARFSTTDPSFEIPALQEDQAVFVRVSALAPSGLRGAPSASRGLEVRLRLALGLLSLSAGDVNQSIAEFQAALPNYPTDVNLLRDLGWSFFLAGQYGDARETYLRATDLAQDDADLLLELGRVHFMLDDFEAAVETYQRVLGNAPEDPDALWGLGDTYRAMGRDEEAASLLRQALRLQPDHPYARESLEMLTGR